jgi:hypothetical protein
MAGIAKDGGNKDGENCVRKLTALFPQLVKSWVLMVLCFKPLLHFNKVHLQHKEPFYE